MTEKNLALIQQQIDVLEVYLDSYELCAPQISQWTIGHHLEHLNKGHGGLLKRLATGDRDGGYPKRAINLRGKIVLFLRRIPRSRGKAPDHTLPLNFDLERLRRGVESQRYHASQLQQLADLSVVRKVVFQHPYFGYLDGYDWLKFFTIHAHHHLKIIREIEQAAARPPFHAASDRS